MPCDTIITQHLDGALSNADPTLLINALESLGFNTTIQDTSKQIVAFKDGESITWTKGEGFTIRTKAYMTATKAEQVVQSYSGMLVKHAAQKHGWKIKQNGVNKYQIMKGGF